MALVIYSNGIVEEYLPVDDTFTDKELVDMFPQYSSIGSHRFKEVVNSWIVWGEMVDPPENEYSKLASELVGVPVHSHILIIHDSELNPSWNVTDDILYHDYTKFMEDLGLYIQSLMDKFTIMTQEEIDNSTDASMIFLTAIGHTEDKRVMFAFNPHEQHENFYFDGGFSIFAEKMYEYLEENFDKEPIEKNKPFVIFSDAKSIVIIEDPHVDKVISDMTDYFMKKEKYEICSGMASIKQKWHNRKTLPILDPSTGVEKKKKGRPPKKT